MAGLSMCTALVELYLSHNGIWALGSGLTNLTGLKVRHASAVVSVAVSRSLQELWSGPCRWLASRVPPTGCTSSCAVSARSE